MTLKEQLENYLHETGESKRALSLRAGLSAKTVSNILNLRGLKPSRATIERLSAVTGLDLSTDEKEPAETYAGLLQRLEASGDPAARRRAKRLRWLVRNAEWVPQTRYVSRSEITAYFASITPAAVGLSAPSLATYKSDILAALECGHIRRRRRDVRDIGGVHAKLHAAIKESGLSREFKLLSGTFCVYLHDEQFAPGDVTVEVLQRYYAHRLAESAKPEAACRKHVKRVANLFSRMSEDPAFRSFGIRPVAHPFSDGRDKFDVPDTAIAPLMEEWDTRVVPWALGEASRDGQSRAEFIAMLDAAEPAHESNSKIAKLRNLRRARGSQQEPTSPRNQRAEALLSKHGFLTPKYRWSVRTAANRRAQVQAIAKALYATSDVAIETLEELTDPEVLEHATEALRDANAGKDYDSEYVSSVVKTVSKVARGLVGRSDDDIERITALAQQYETKRKGIAPRVRAKLHRFTEQRIQRMIDLTDTLLREINVEIDRRRKAFRREHGFLPQPGDVTDAEMARDVMAALAHAIMMKRAPRRENLIGLRLDWVSWQDGRAIIRIPALHVKMRDVRDADLVIPLGSSASKLLRVYLDSVRAKALRAGDEANPHLFPGQDTRSAGCGQPYRNLLTRLMRRVHAHVGVRMNPHLYRHLIGWIWLKVSLDNLPKVQKLLGHKSLQTTIDHYAEIDEGLALDAWQEELSGSAG